MKRRLLLVVGLALVAAIVGFLGLNWFNNREPAMPAMSDDEVAAKLAQFHGKPPPAPPVPPKPLDPSRPVRLAIGSLGFRDDERNRQLADLVTVRLGSSAGLEIIEREALSAVLQEQSMSLSGLVRAKDAVKVGKLLRADWFLLGSECSVGGTNLLVTRAVDAQTGVIRDVGIFPKEPKLTDVASAVAGFVRQARQAANVATPQVYLAFGSFADVGVNNRQAQFPPQIRAYLTSAYRGSKVTLLERDSVEALLNEVRLDLAGLTEEGSMHDSVHMQSAFWIVDGFFQSQETGGLEVELAIDVKRSFDRTTRLTFRGAPEEALFRKIKVSIDESIAAAKPFVSAPKRRYEINEQLDKGRQLLTVAWGSSPEVYALLGFGTGSPAEERRRRHNVQEAIRAFQAVLLLDPTNREAKVFLAGSYADWIIGRVDEAESLFHEVAEATPPDRWSKEAQRCRDYLRSWRVGRAKAWDKQEPAEREALERAENNLVEAAPTATGAMHDQLSSFQALYGTNAQAAAEAMIRLWSKMKTRAPAKAPEILAAMVKSLPDTNSPLVGEFRMVLAQYARNPGEFQNPRGFHRSVVLFDYAWAVDNKQHQLAAEMMESLHEAATKLGTDGFSREDWIRLAFAYVGQENWREAQQAFEAVGEDPVRMSIGGRWGHPFKPFLPTEAVAVCRQKLGLPAVHYPARFQLGSPCLCLHSPGAHNVSSSELLTHARNAFAATEDGLWVARERTLVNLDFNLKTNVEITLPETSDAPIAAIWPGEGKVWIGTQGSGLIEFDKATRECRVFTADDGLLMEYVGCLHERAGTLWLGFGDLNTRRANLSGGIGKLDLATDRLSGFTPSLPSNPLTRKVDNPFVAVEAPDGPPSHAIQDIGTGKAGSLWMLILNHGLRNHEPGGGTWTSPPAPPDGEVVSFASNAKRLVAGLSQEQIELTIQCKITDEGPTSTTTNCIVTNSRLRQLEKDQTLTILRRARKAERRGGLAVFEFDEGQWHSLLPDSTLPAPPTSILLDGNKIVAAGWGYVAVVDGSKKMVQKICYINYPRVDRMQIAGGYLWLQYDQHLRRVKLDDLR